MGENGKTYFIVAIVCGGVIVLIIIAVLIYCIVKCCRKGNNNKPPNQFQVKPANTSLTERDNAKTNELSKHNIAFA